MKIALVNNYYYLRGGSERVLFGDQQALIAAGHEVQPFAPQDERNEPADLQALFPRCADPTATGVGRQLKAAADLVYSLAAGQAFARFLEVFQPDMVHCHNIYGRLTTAILDEASRRRIPVVMTVHDQKLVCPAYLGLRRSQPCQLCRDGAYWRCVRWKCHKQSRAASLVYTVESYFNRYTSRYDSVSRFLCPSQFMQHALIDSGIASERVAYHPNALAPENYSPQFTAGDYVLYTGRLSAEKGIMTMLAALERSEIPLQIAGTGPLAGRIQRYITEHQMQAQMHGHCSGEELAQLYRNSAFTIVPSEWNENASMSVLEAFAYGKPVLAADVGGNPELVIEGETGRLFPSGVVEELAQGARRMWADREQLKQMGMRAQRLIVQRFSQAGRVADLLAIYNSVLQDHPRSAQVC